MVGGENGLVKVACLKQEDNKACGLTCLLMIIRYYQGNVSKEYLKDELPFSHDGVTFYRLLEVAKKIGLDGYGVEGKLDKFDTTMLPCIAHIIINNTYEHFVVISDISFKKRYIVLEDPSRGHLKMTFEQFEKESTQEYLILKPYRPLLNIESVPNIKIDTYLSTKKSYFIKDILLTIVITFLSIYSAFYMNLLITYALNIQKPFNILVIAIFIGFLEFLKLFANYLGVYNRMNLQNELSFLLYKDLLDQVLLLPYTYYKNRSTGDILNRFQDISVVVEGKLEKYFSLYKNVILTCVFLFILFLIQKWLALLMFFYFLFSFIISQLVNSKEKKNLSSYEIENSRFSVLVLETLQGVDTVKGNHQESLFGWKLLGQVKNLLSKFYQLIKLKISENELKNILEVLFSVSLNAFGILLVLEKHISLGSLMAFLLIFENAKKPFNEILECLVKQRSYHVSLERILDLFELKPESFKLDCTYQGAPLQGEIIVRNLTYASAGKKIIRNLSLHVFPGDKVLFTGASGSGKSTFLKVLFRYYDVNRGCIYIDNKDLMDYHLEDIRSRIVYSAQQEFIFTDTIYKNIILERKITYAQFLDICKLTLVDEIVKRFPLGYQTVLEENGFTLSGGERERIILARTLLSNADIFLLDESFSEIDISKEKIILQNIFSKFINKTFIVVSHRLDNANLFNYSILLEEYEK